MGSIQRETKFGLDYSADDYVALMNGASAKLTPRDDLGQGYYRAKIEGSTFFKYYFNALSGGWEVTTKAGITYYYGTSSDSRQENDKGVFKWCLDNVKDTNGNYMTVAYTKDQGQIYLKRIYYTGHSTLSPTNYVNFILEDRNDEAISYASTSEVVTAKRLKSIEIYGNNELARRYGLEYSSSSVTNRSLLAQITQYGTDGSTSPGCQLQTF